jgi:hypothetical protein
MEGVKTWLRSQAADFIDTGIQVCNKCLKYDDDYVQK